MDIGGTELCESLKLYFDGVPQIRYSDDVQKWFKRLYIPFLLLIVTAGMLTVLKAGYTPPPVKMMKPSFFDKTEEIGAVVFRRAFPAVETQAVVAFGIPPQPDWHQGIVRGFLKAAAAENRPFAAIISEEQMPKLNLEGFSGLEEVVVPTNSQTQSELVDALKKFAAEKKRVLLYMPSVFSTHMISGNPIERLEKTLGTRVVSFTSGPLSLRNEQEYLVDPPCVGSERDSNGTSTLGCTILQSGRGYYRKKVPQDRWVAIMNSPKPDDYLVMASTPNQGSDAAEKNRALRMTPPGPAK